MIIDIILNTLKNEKPNDMYYNTSKFMTDFLYIIIRKEMITRGIIISYVFTKTNNDIIIQCDSSPNISLRKIINEIDQVKITKFLLEYAI